VGPTDLLDQVGLLPVRIAGRRLSSPWKPEVETSRSGQVVATTTPSAASTRTTG
jgi:hypothetical protein